MTEMRASEYVGWGGKPESVIPNLKLGVGSTRDLPGYGLRRAVWDAAFGYVSGFRKRAILYYLLTRSLNHRLSIWAMKREGVEFRDGVAVGKVVRR